MNSTLKFKTNINCNGCLTKVSPILNKMDIIEWNVDLSGNDKLLTVITKSLNESDIIKSLSDIGFKAEIIR